jgi:hypothetical protein
MEEWKGRKGTSRSFPTSRVVAEERGVCSFTHSAAASNTLYIYVYIGDGAEVGMKNRL